MIGRILGMGAIAALCLLGAEEAFAGDPDGGPLKFRMENGNAIWQDYQGEAAYRVSVSISYLPPPSCLPGGLRIDAEKVEASQELTSDTTSFPLPRPTDLRLTWAKDMSITVEAIDANGKILATDGVASVADKFCTPEEIAAELAAAGTGPQGGSAGALLVGIVALGVLGITCLSGSLLMLRRKA